MRVEFGKDDRSSRQLDIVLHRFMCGESLSALSCLPDGVSPSSFNRLYKWLKEGTHTKGGKRYKFNEHWSQEINGHPVKGAYKIRILLGEVCEACSGFGSYYPSGTAQSITCLNCKGSGVSNNQQMELAI